ncbi:hypothetical protein Tco_0389796 [Tanacetum coccineum]
MNLVTTLSDRIGVLEADLKKTKSIYSSAYTKLILRVKKLEARVKIGKARRQARVILSDDEDLEDDSSKQGRKLSDAEIQEKAKGSEKASDKVSTAGAKTGTASKEVLIVSTTEMRNKELKLLEMKRLLDSGIKKKGKELWMKLNAEHGSGKQKSPEKSPEKMKSAEKMEEDDVAKETGAKRKKFIPRKSTRKRQKMEEDVEKEELKETFMYYQVFRGDGSSKNYKILSEMLEDFDRLDVEELYRLVKERYSASRPEGFDLMLWGDLHTLFEPDEDDEIWKY